ncbi:pyruvate dehydrogenase (acetyl-transferring) E1 component subunit alpha [Criblamydia sequanensis]|uniref:Pyruvate dehydrogenase E1 component subunit alpha n=1 Tax=Candidatus Criblamydia sequanensis CRIB-18 TaxID=1437425 RepID=A0A090CZ13_9BACT|nr:pyruvate dehydrogenase (acetyl-transferring) E1 component subunit alpha [Criblamydia sequanensis]CDR33911.1 Pyruvate dehydrogenase E1 component alpha subunit [Criblamydia sequanensis CRIB-18]
MEPRSSKERYKMDSELQKKLMQSLGKDRLIDSLKKMLLIRNFEIRAESAYQQGFIGGFFHSYMGQEAIQTAAVAAMGKENWWATSYRCHALALLLGATPDEIMAELYGRANGNAKGRGGSMHLYTDRLLGGFGIVGGQIPIATGAGFTIKYEEKKEASICFLGDGAVAQGSFHESLNLASLWKLPCIFVIENNIWGMGTHISRAISVPRLAEDKAASFGMEGFTLNGMDFFECYEAFSTIYQNVLKTSKPVLIEVITERFRGHSISDPGLYRSKEDLKVCMERDPILMFRDLLEENGILTEDHYKELDHEAKEIAKSAMKYAEESPWPSPITLEEDVFKEN